MNRRIDDNKYLTTKCTGCLACCDVCPKKCISPIVAPDGFRYVAIDDSKCIRCGKCFSVCPIENIRKNTDERHLFAAYAKDKNIRNSGSSGGVFELLARLFLSNGYAVCGAAFEGTNLRHRLVYTEKELASLLKSKYIQSDTRGIYFEIQQHLRRGGKVMFCGTPCQVSALKNTILDSQENQIFTVDIICHGVPSQTTFNMYLQTVEEKEHGRITDFNFRVKDNRYRHAHGYSYCVNQQGKDVIKHGIYLQSSFYNAFKKYLIFRESCYSCNYASIDRVSDITLGDFWGIEKYSFDADTDAGVSMVITNTPMGGTVFNNISPELVFKEYPLEYGIESNYCLTHATVKPKIRDAVIESMEKKGYEFTARKYFQCNLIEKIYVKIPPNVRDIRKKIRKG